MYNWVTYFDCNKGHEGEHSEECPHCRIAELEAERHSTDLLIARINHLEQQLAELREALETISRLEPYDGDRHAYHIAGKVARAALQESDK